MPWPPVVAPRRGQGQDGAFAGGLLGGLVPRHGREGLAHGAGVGRGRERQAGPDDPGEGPDLRGDELAAGQAQDHEGPGHKADLPLKVPAVLALDDVPAGSGEAGCAAGQDVGGVDSGLGQALAGLLGAHAGLADQDHTAAQAGGELVGVLGQQRQRHVVGAADVHGLELGGGADIDHHEVLVLCEPGLEGFRGECGNGRCRGRGSHGWPLGRGRVDTPPSITDTPGGSQNTLGGIRLREAIDIWRNPWNSIPLN